MLNRTTKNILLILALPMMVYLLWGRGAFASHHGGGAFTNIQYHNGTAVVNREYQLKAAFLFNFVQFTKWPPQKQSTEYRICIIGNDPFGNVFDTLRNKTVNNVPVTVKRFTAIDSTLSQCHVLFIAESAANSMDAIIASVKNTNVLTVSDIENFTKKGGMIGLVKKQTKIGMEINLSHVREEEIDISSRVLQLADIVSP